MQEPNGYYRVSETHLKGRDMFADESRWCDWCCVELVSDGPGRLKGRGQSVLSKPALFGDRICGECDAKVVRGPAVYKIKPNKSVAKYVRDVESGRTKPPYRSRVTVESPFGPLDMESPVKLKADGRLRPGDRKPLSEKAKELAV